MFNELKEILKLAWENDDMIMQETLFELQDRLAEVTLQAAKTESQKKQLVKEFPWLYHTTEN